MPPIVAPWAGSDPDFDASAVTDWRVFDRPLDPAPEQSLAALGIGHKALLHFSA